MTLVGVPPIVIVFILLLVSIPTLPFHRERITNWKFLIGLVVPGDAHKGSL